jgi:hypothetical protein
VPGASWSDDHPGDGDRIAANAAAVLADVAAVAEARGPLTTPAVRGWHQRAYDGCRVPDPVYVGRYRGKDHPSLVDYEVGIGPDLVDGWPERMGVPAAQVDRAITVFFAAVGRALEVLDAALPVGRPPQTFDELAEVVAVVASVHGEWVRIHPFVNGNGRTARLLAAHVSLRYGLPVFVTLKPRPDDIAYARAAKASMGRPPAFAGDHSEAIAVFTHMLALKLLGD